MPNFNRSGGGRGGNKFGKKSFGKRGFGGGRDSGRTEMHKATCSDCGKTCEVPFKPTGDRPVFCSNCFKNGGNPNPRRSDEREYRNRDFGRDSGRPGMHKAICDECGDSCEVPFRPAGDKPVFCNNCFKKGGGSTGNNTENKSPDQFKEQFEILNAKLDGILKALISVAPKEVIQMQASAEIKESKPKKASKKVKEE